MNKKISTDESKAKKFLAEHIESFLELSIDEKEIVANQLFDIWIDEKIDEAERKLEEDQSPILTMASGGLDDIHGKALILALLLSEEQKIKENEVFALVEQILFDLGYEKDPFERGKDRDSNGKFVESEAKKNRRVVVLDVNDPIAQEILQNR